MSCSHAEFGELELQQPHLTGNPGFDGDRNDVQVMSREYTGKDAVVNLKVLKNQITGSERSPNGFQRQRSRRVNASLARLRGRRFLESSHQVGLTFASLALKTGDALQGTLLGPQLLPLNQVVVPVELFANVANGAHKFTAGDIIVGQHGHRAGDQLQQ